MIATISQWTLLGMASFFVILVSSKVYAKAEVAFNNQPTPPRYLVRPPIYNTSRAIFGAFSLCLFSLIIIFDEDISKLDPLLPDFVSNVLEGLGDVDKNFSVTVVVSAWLFVALTSIRLKYNPIILMRDLIYSRAAIPQKAEMIARMAENIDTIPVEIIEKVVESHSTNAVSVGDFDLSPDTVEFKWALCSYYRYYLGQQTGPEITIFSEPSFAWDKIKEEYLQISTSYQSLRSDSHNLSNEQRKTIFDQIDSLLRKLCRLVACFLFFSSNTEEKFWRKAGSLGISVDTTRVFFRYGRNMAKLMLAIVVAIIVGTIVVSTGYDIGHSGIEALSSTSGNPAFRWLVFGLVMYVPPVAFVVALRHFSLSTDWRRPEDPLGTFAVYFVAGFAICILTLIFLGPHLAALFSTQPPPQTPPTTGARVLSAIRWSLAPGILCAYAALRLQGGRLCQFGEADDRWDPLKRGILVGSVVGLVVLLVSLTGKETLELPNGDQSHLKFLSVATAVAFLIGGFSAAIIDRGRQQRLIGPDLLTMDQLVKTLIGIWSVKESYAHGKAVGTVQISEKSEALCGKMTRKLEDTETNRSFDVTNELKIEIGDGGTIKFMTTSTEVGEGGPEDFDPDTWVGQLISMKQMTGRIFDSTNIQGKFAMEKTSE